jgi:hypothetical protein
MRTVTTDVYQFTELATAAQDTAIEQIREKLAGPWWDNYDTESITEVMVYTLAERFGSPGWDTYGCADFPGIPDVSHESWSLDRHRHLSLSGYLDRDSAPALPWVDGIDSVTLIAERSGTTVDVINADPDVTVTDEQRSAVEDAVTDAIHAALTAGDAELEYKTSAEYAREIAESYEFTEEGHLYP